MLEVPPAEGAAAFLFFFFEETGLPFLDGDAPSFDSRFERRASDMVRGSVGLRITKSPIDILENQFRNSLKAGKHLHYCLT
jgi:hypothetical protein